MNNDAEIIKSLDVPGAGLPKPELLVARILFASQYALTSRTASARGFTEESSKILTMAKSLSSDNGAKRILINRLPGLEDSSRFWSVYMTMDHICIVNKGVQGIINALVQNKQLSRAVSTAEVKPDPSIGQEVLDRFSQTCADFQKTSNSIENLKTDRKWAHPWFGSLDADQWHFLAFFHMRLHRKQIEKIISGL